MGKIGNWKGWLSPSGARFFIYGSYSAGREGPRLTMLEPLRGSLGRDVSRPYLESELCSDHNQAAARRSLGTCGDGFEALGHRTMDAIYRGH